MLPTFRLMLVAVAAVFVVLMVAARGLVPSPEATTRIGEVPIVGRALLQLSVIPVDETQRRLMIASGLPGELETADAEPPAAPQAPSAAAAEASAAAGTALPLVAADERGRRAAPVPPSIDPLGDLIRAVLPETPEPAPRAPVATAEEAVPAGEGGHMLTEAPVQAPAQAPVQAQAQPPADPPPADAASAVAAAALPSVETVAPESQALGFAAEPAGAGRPGIVLPAAPDEATASVTVPAAAPGAPAAAPQAAPAPAVAAVTPSPGAEVKPAVPAAKPSVTKVRRAAKPAPRKKVRVVARRTTQRAAPAQAPASSELVFPNYAPFSATPTQAAPTRR